MSKKILAGVLITSILLLSSCASELSMQEYDDLKNDLMAAETERDELRAEVSKLKPELSRLQAELNENKAKDAETLAYARFLDRLLSIQTSELVLSGEFDVEVLTGSSANLTAAAKELRDPEVIYYLELIKPDNEKDAFAAYYKAIEYCLKEMKQNLE